MRFVKLVIWDLDETLWSGTLSEGTVEINPEFASAIRELTDKGIINSIISKNDFDIARNVLEKNGLWDYFVFPQINWGPKGENCRVLLDNANLRAENALFIDDNAFNRNEVAFYHPGIWTMDPKEISDGFFDGPEFLGKNDKAHTRLKQYKILEEQSLDKKLFENNDDFLQQSGITVSIGHDCLAHEERIVELIGRTNQMNFTKYRASKNEVHEMLLNPEYQCGYVVVQDKYGDYGIVGFYALYHNQLVHYLFSCRILGMGVEAFVYRKLHSPKVEIIGEVAGALDTNPITWITEVAHNVLEETVSVGNEAQGNRILLIGGCEVRAMNTYLRFLCVDKELNEIIDGIPIRKALTENLLGSIEYSDAEKMELCDHIPFYLKGVTYETKLFDGIYRTIVLSVVDNYVSGTYFRNDNYSFQVSSADYFRPISDVYPTKPLEVAWLHDHFTYAGPKKPTSFKIELDRIIDYLDADTKVILINGIDIALQDGKYASAKNYLILARNREMNTVVDTIVAERKNVHLLDMRKLVHSEDDLTENVRHFKRIVYYKMAQELERLCNDDGVSSLKMIHDVSELLRLCKDRRIFCFGAGETGKRMKKWLEQQGMRVTAFLATRRRMIEFENVPIYMVDEFDFSQMSQDCLMLISVKRESGDKNQNEIVEALKARGYYDFYCISEACWDVILK